jgi:Lrp/AsnC family leucine-responsive transcriptional regulator
VGDGVVVDATDLAIIQLLEQDGRRTAADMAGRVSLSSTAVARRIERLENAGVILGYTARIDHRLLGASLQAFVEVKFAGKTRPDTMNEVADRLPQALGVFITAGTYDALIWIRVRVGAVLRSAIDQLRTLKTIVDTRTHVVLEANLRSAASNGSDEVAASSISS